MKKLFVYLTIVCALVSCELEKEIDIEGAKYKDMLYIRGYVSREKGAYVEVGKVLPAATDSWMKKNVSDAEVYLMSEGKEIAKLPYQPHYGLYYSKVDQYDCSSYSIVVKKGDIVAYSTEQAFPKQVEIDSVVLIQKQRRDVFEANVYFQNQEDVAGYYCHAKGDTQESIEWFENVFEYNMTHFNGDEYNDFIKQMSRGKTVLTTDFYCWDMSDTNYYEVDLIHISDAFDRYLKSEYENQATADDIFFDNPYPYYSNITGGAGFFGACTFSVHKGIILPRW